MPQTDLFAKSYYTAKKPQLRLGIVVASDDNNSQTKLAFLASEVGQAF